MKFLLAPDSFKGSMTARQAVEAMERGVHGVFPDAECVRAPMADGGEGTTDALVAALAGRIVEVGAHDALGRAITATYGLVPDERLAIVEVAAAAGIELVAPDERDPMRASSYGVGEILLDALERGSRRLIVGLGGTATNDGGAGMLQALGIRLLDIDGYDLPVGAAALEDLVCVDATGLDPRWTQVRIDIASDVTNPLLGGHGASAEFGPQKGATAEMVATLDHALAVFAGAVAGATGVDVSQDPGSGAAGGLGAAFLAFFDARMLKGVEVVMSAGRFEERIPGADFVFTGEGGMDSQTVLGKTPFGVAQAAGKFGVPVIGFAGQVGEGAEVLYQHGFAAIVPILPSVTDLPTALANGAINLESAVQTVCRLLAVGGPGTISRGSVAVLPATDRAAPALGSAGLC